MPQILTPIFLFVLSLSLWRCSVKEQSALPGKWLMHQVLRAGDDVTLEHNPYGERYIILETNTKYTSDGRPYGANTGRYDYNPEVALLKLDSDVGPEDDSQWRVQLGQDTMRWQGVGTEWATQFEIIYLRTP